MWNTIIGLYIWKSRNDRIFNNQVKSIEEMVEDIKILSWRWVLSRLNCTLVYSMSGVGTQVDWFLSMKHFFFLEAGVLSFCVVLWLCCCAATVQLFCMVVVQVLFFSLLWA